MSNIISIIENIKQSLTTNEETIINTIKDINPVILMYYQLNIDSSLEYYNNKLPKEYFNIFSIELDEIPDNDNEYLIIDDEEELEFNYDKCYQIEPNTRELLLELENFPLIQYYYEKYKKYIHCNKIFCDIATKFIKNNNFDSIKAIYPTIVNENYLIFEIINQNNIKMLGQVLNILNKDFDVIKFFKYNCGHIIQKYNIDIIKKIYELSQKSYNNFCDINIIFNSSLVYGNQQYMQFALDKGATFEMEEKDNIYRDTILYAIVGNNLNCLQTVIDMFSDKLIEKQWMHYLLFAATYGTPEIINFLLLHKPYMVEKIYDFYNKILKFALCNGNIECVKFAITHGAKFNNKETSEFINYYNILYKRSNQEDYSEDSYDFLNKIRTIPFNIHVLYEDCIEYIKQN
jgi:hypothetical protein